MEFIPITINNRITFVRPHSTVLQACELAGVEVPRFCYHEKLSVAGNCRRCLVEVQKSPKPIVSCARPITKGRVVYTDTPLVRKAREAVLEFLLINHPLDCPICDQGGECDLQDETFIYGSDSGRYIEFKRSVEDKETGPIIKTIRTRCIHCTRCIRFSSEVAGHEVMGAFGRGEEMEIGTYIQSFIRTELSGNLVDLCPVGALTSKPYAYQARSWELQRVDTLDFFDALCSDISVYTRKQSNQALTSNFGKKNISVYTQEGILRILPRTNGFYSENWISDRTRYAFDGLKRFRANVPQIRNSNGQITNLSWNVFLDQLSFWQIFPSSFFYKKLNKLVKNEDLTNSATSTRHFFVGSQTNLERTYSLSIFAKIMGNTNYTQGLTPVSMKIDAPFFYSFNRSLQSHTLGFFSGIYFIGTNLRFEASLLNTRLRREQNSRPLKYFSVGVFNSFRFGHKHQGNNLRTLFSSLESRFPSIHSSVLSPSATLIRLGVESLRRYSGVFLQRLVSLIGKRFFTKNKKDDRLGYIHSSIGTLAFAHLGLQSKTFYNVKKSDVENPVVFNIHQLGLNQTFFTRNNKTNPWVISFDTHNITNAFPWKVNLPLTSLYEREGHVLTLEGRTRKQQKALAISNKGFTQKQRRSLETIFSALCRKQGNFTWFRWVEGLSFFNVECPTQVSLDTINENFFRSPFAYEIHSNFGVKLVPFFQTVRNFYLQEPIAAYSRTRGESSLFIGYETNFISEMLFNLFFFIYLI